MFIHCSLSPVPLSSCCKMSDLKTIEANGTVSNGVVPEAALKDKEREPVNDVPSSPSDSEESQLPAKEKPISTVLTIIRHFDLIW